MSNRMLFEPYNLAGLELKNRIVRSATFEKMADENGFVTPRLAGLYEELAAGGCGLIVTGGALVHPSGRALRQMLSIHSDRYMEGLAGLAAAVHSRGGLVAVQLNHGGRQSRPLLLGGKAPLAPSAVHDPATGSTPRAMEESVIWEIVDSFGDAAWRARAAGFDAVELQGAHGYLISSFLSPHTNRRDDYWGGDEERRFHFAEEVLRAVRRAVGEDYPVLMKMNSDDLVPGGMLPEESARHARRLEEVGLDAVEISSGMMESEINTSRHGILEPSLEAYLRGSGALFKRALGIPVILTGGMRTAAVIEEVLNRGEADLIGLSRPLIREPHLPSLLMEGKAGADCISCNRCTRFSRIPYVRCMQKGG